MVVRLVLLSLVAVLLLALCATTTLAREPSLSQRDLEDLLADHPNLNLKADHDGPLPTRSEVEAAIEAALAVKTAIEHMPTEASSEEATAAFAGANGTGDADIEYHRVCNAATPGLTGKVRFQFWLDSDGSEWTGINKFKAKFIPAPTLPTIGGIDIEAIEGTITNKYNYPSANNQKWVGAANVTITLTYFEYFEMYLYSHVLCSVQHP